MEEQHAMQAHESLSAYDRRTHKESQSCGSGRPARRDPHFGPIGRGKAGVTVMNRLPCEEMCILVVEDDYLVASDIESALLEAGFEVAGIATSAEEAVKLAASQHPILAVMDIRLAGRRDGVDVALELFAQHGIRCVFATAHYDQHVRARAAPAHPLGWVQKPYSMSVLIMHVRQALRDLEDANERHSPSSDI
jgi:two-component system, response regulator PdtaR